LPCLAESSKESFNLNYSSLKTILYEDDSNLQIDSLSFNNNVPIENLYQQTSLSLNVNNVVNYVSYNTTSKIYVYFSLVIKSNVFLFLKNKIKHTLKFVSLIQI